MRYCCTECMYVVLAFDFTRYSNDNYHSYAVDRHINYMTVLISQSLATVLVMNSLAPTSLAF